MSLEGATILLTGGTGSFGRAFAARMKARSPSTIIRIYSRDELKQSEMLATTGNGSLRYFVGDVRDADRLRRAMRGVDYVVHAAAMKQVVACEYNPSEAVQTNVNGAQNVVDAAIDAGVLAVVALSTDKAVHPVNLYGATKLCMEKIITQGNSYVGSGPTRLACVRYGNVLGSRGSVVPVFRRQAEQGRITITDERMTRFWITLDQAIDLVVSALAEANGGEIFVPKIPSMRVTDLADVIAPGVPQEVTGIRPGEKLHEELLTADEARHAVDLDDKYVILPEHPSWSSPDRDGKPLEEEFSYNSLTNPEWLSSTDLAGLVSEL
jgi:UDP-N-acetylglucosamine 4,6-dehydratase